MWAIRGSWQESVLPRHPLPANALIGVHAQEVDYSPFVILAHMIKSDYNILCRGAVGRQSLFYCKVGE